MVDRPNKPTALATTPGLAPQATVNITHDNSRVEAILPTGERVEILLYGATVISWKDAAGREKLWLSEAAKLDGSKAVRGGIPLVFPVFGTAPDHAATSKLPQHGFARTSRWEFLGKSTSESTAAAGSVSDSSVKLDFGLSSSNLSEESKASWPYDFGLIYSVTLSRDSLATSIVVTNEGSSAWEFQLLTHTYFKVDEIEKTTVLGLNSASYVDKVDNAATKSESADEVSFSGETDRVYTPVGGPSAPLTIVESGKKTFEIVRDNLGDAVVWNPWQGKADGISDFEPKSGWHKMLCVEAGAVQGWQKLEAGEAFEGGQIIKALL